MSSASEGLDATPEESCHAILSDGSHLVYLEDRLLPEAGWHERLKALFVEGALMRQEELHVLLDRLPRGTGETGAARHSAVGTTNRSVRASCQLHRRRHVPGEQADLLLRPDVPYSRE